MAARGASPREIDRTDEVLDPRAMTIGFARRFTGYKRPVDRINCYQLFFLQLLRLSG